MQFNHVCSEGKTRYLKDLSIAACLGGAPQGSKDLALNFPHATLTAGFDKTSALLSGTSKIFVWALQFYKRRNHESYFCENLTILNLFTKSTDKTVKSTFFTNFFLD